jgi:hypothetical protein
MVDRRLGRLPVEIRSALGSLQCRVEREEHRLRFFGGSGRSRLGGSPFGMSESWHPCDSGIDSKRPC